MDESSLQKLDEVENRLIRAEGTIAWMRWCWITVGTIIATVVGGFATDYFTSLASGSEPDAKVVMFDCLGTVFDIRGAMVRESLDPGTADAWIGAYGTRVERCRLGVCVWRPAHVLAGQSFQDLDLRLVGSSETLVRRVWWEADAFSDSAPGLLRLRERGYAVVALTNASLPMLISMSRQAGITWDATLTADMIGQYKPSPTVYRRAQELLGVPFEQLVLVSAHDGSDLRAAHDAGCRTALIQRGAVTGTTSRNVNYVAHSIGQLADLLP